MITMRSSRTGRRRAKCSTVVPIPRNIARTPTVSSAARLAMIRFSLRVMQRACVGADLEGPDEVRGGAAVGAPHEAVALEAAQVAADGHLGDLEVARQRADLDGLVLRDPLQHLQAPFDR